MCKIGPSDNINFVGEKGINVVTTYFRNVEFSSNINKIVIRYFNCLFIFGDNFPFLTRIIFSVLMFLLVKLGFTFQKMLLSVTELKIFKILFLVDLFG